MIPPRSRSRICRTISFSRFQVGLEDRVLERSSAHVAAGVDVDRDQRLGLVDDDVAARLQPDLGRSARSSSPGHAVVLEDGRVPRMQRSTRLPARAPAASNQLQRPLVLPLLVEADGRDVVDESRSRSSRCTRLGSRCSSSGRARGRRRRAPRSRSGSGNARPARSPRAAAEAGGADDEAAAAPSARISLSIDFSRRRSSSSAILRETPTCSTVGM